MLLYGMVDVSDCFRVFRSFRAKEEFSSSSRMNDCSYCEEFRPEALAMQKLTQK